MKRKLNISAQFSGVLPVGAFANMRPGFSASMEFEQEFKTEEEVSMTVEACQQQLQAICYQSFEREADKARIQKIQEDMKSFRFYEDEAGTKMPSVTSVLGYDKEFFCTDDELKQYASQGNIIDAEIRNFVKTGKYVQSKDLLECTADRFIIKKGSKQLALEGWDFVGFLSKFPIENLKSHEKPLFNKQYRYAGTPDLEGIYNGLPTLVSIKRTYRETDNFTQDSAYAKCDGMEHIKQIMVVEMKAEQDGGNKSGYSKPRITSEIDKYFELFKSKRAEFMKVYGI